MRPYSPERFTIKLEDAGRGPPTSHAVLQCYLSALHLQVSLRRPAHLYGHPEVLGRMAGAVLPDLFDAVRRLGLPNMTVADFAHWWMERDKADLRLLVDEGGGTLTIETTGAAVEVYAKEAGQVILDGRTHGLAPGHWTVLTRNHEPQP